MVNIQISQCLSSQKESITKFGALWDGRLSWNERTSNHETCFGVEAKVEASFNCATCALQEVEQMTLYFERSLIFSLLHMSRFSFSDHPRSNCQLHRLQLNLSHSQRKAPFRCSLSSAVIWSAPPKENPHVNAKSSSIILAM